MKFRQIQNKVREDRAQADVAKLLEDRKKLEIVAEIEHIREAASSVIRASRSPTPVFEQPAAEVRERVETPAKIQNDATFRDSAQQ